MKSHMSIKSPPQERDHISVMNVGKVLFRVPILFNISEYTLGRNHLGATTVGKAIINVCT